MIRRWTKWHALAGVGVGLVLAGTSVGQRIVIAIRNMRGAV